MMILQANSTGRLVNNLQTDELDQEQLNINRWLILVAEKQDKVAFSQLFKWFAPRVRAHGLKRFGQEAMAMELVQETMLLVWRKAGLYHPEKGKASTWIYTLMRNYCFDMLRKKQSNKEEQLSDDLWPLIDEDQREQEVAQQDHLLSRQLIAHIDALPSLQQQVVRAIFIEDKTQLEVANDLGVPLGTIKSRLRLAMSKLKLKLEDTHD